MRALHDPSISFEEYYYFAQKTRAEEEDHHLSSSGQTRGIFSTIFPSRSGNRVEENSEEKHRGSLMPNVNTSDPNSHASVTDQEWTNASRAVRTATAGAVFYLITTDILGPFGLPYAFATTGWGEPMQKAMSIVIMLTAHTGQELHSIRSLDLWLACLAGYCGNSS